MGKLKLQSKAQEKSKKQTSEAELDSLSKPLSSDSEPENLPKMKTTLLSKSTESKTEKTLDSIWEKEYVLFTELPVDSRLNGEELDHLTEIMVLLKLLSLRICLLELLVLL